MRNLVKISAIAFVALFAMAANASDIEFHGYARIGMGLNSQGGNAVCYHLMGADADYRLGNECDYVIEPNFDYKMAKLDDKSEWGVHVMPKVYKRWLPMDGRDADPLVMWFGQAYFYGSNVPQLLNGTIWAGRKYHDRLQSGINDQFWENDDNTGFGIEDMNLGFAKWSVAIGSDPNVGGTSADDLTRDYSIVTNLKGIQTVKDGSLSIFLGYYGQSANSNAADTDYESGYKAGIYHNWNLGKWGSNLIGFKYAKNDTMSGADGDANQGQSYWRVLFQHGIGFAAARTNLDFLAEYRSKTTEGVSDPDTWFTIGARTDTQLSGPFRFLLEAGYDRVNTDDAEWPYYGDAGTLLKITGALAMSAGKDPWSRPTFRLYYTYGSWSEVGYNNDWWNTENAQAAFGTDKSGGSFGVQAEGWW